MGNRTRDLPEITVEMAINATKWDRHSTWMELVHKMRKGKIRR